MTIQEERPRVIDFHNEIVLPAVMQRLDQAFPEFGWRRDSRGWVATNQEHTHARLGVRADRVVAHEQHGFLVHGGEPMLWTAYVNGGTVPRGADFVRAVREMAERAGVDPSPLDRPEPGDRRAELLERFFELARSELTSERGARARAYLDSRDFPLDAIEGSGLGLVPSAETTGQTLLRSGYREQEIKVAGVLADKRWPGRLCGAWRNERGTIGTLWARALDNAAGEARYLYLRGASRTNLPPYGLRRNIQELVLVEGFLDYHQLAARGVDNVGALGGTSTSPGLFERLSRFGVETVVLCLDNDDAGRAATCRAVEGSTRARGSPAIYIVDPKTAPAKDPDLLVRNNGIAAWRELLKSRECGISWRVKEMVGDVASDSPQPRRREALGRVGTWLGKLPPRLALEQEDAIQFVAERCGYSAEAVQRAFQARFFREVMVHGQSPAQGRPDRRVESGLEL
jgi:DNA primase